MREEGGLNREGACQIFSPEKGDVLEGGGVFEIGGGGA